MNLGCLVDSSSRNAGGLFESVRRLAQSFPQQHGSTVVFSLEDEHTAEDAPQWQPLAVRTFPAKFFRAWGYAPGLADALLDAKLDILLTHGLWKYSSAAALRWHRRTGRPHIINPHGMLDPWAVRNSPWKKRAAALLYENANLHSAACIRALCKSEAQAIRAYGLRNPICIIPNGIDLPDPERMPISEFQIPNLHGRKVLLYLGRLHPKKNLEPLIRAWAALQHDSAATRDWTLAVAGWDQGGYEAELRRLVSDFSVSAFQRLSVCFLGPQFGVEKAACYANCDAFILPSLSEGLPMVVLEAWAYAKPVLMTDECNLPEGFAAQAALRIGTDATAITTGLRQLLEMSDADRAAMGTRGRALAARKFSWPRIGDEMRQVCEWAVRGGSAPACVRFP